MLFVQFPPPNFRIKEENNKEFIFDEIRKIWVRLTPEEWVRQNFIQYLIQAKKYPSSLLSIEKEIMLGDLKKRYDIVAYKNSIPWLIIECKEMNVTLSEQTVSQILAYQLVLQVAYLIITNGHQTFCFDTNTNKFISFIPEYV